MKISGIFPWISAFALLASSCSRQSHVATIKADGGYEVRIVTDRYWEYQRSFYCELWRDGKKIKSAQFIELTDDAKLELIEGRDKNGFKITDSHTHATIVIYNRKTGESWPWVADNESPQEKHDRQDRLNSLFTDAEQVVDGKPPSATQPPR